MSIFDNFSMLEKDGNIYLVGTFFRIPEAWTSKTIFVKSMGLNRLSLER